MIQKKRVQVQRLLRELRAPMPVLAALLVGAAVAQSAMADSVASRNRQGNKLYTDGKYQEAEKAYLDAQGAEPGRPELLYNMGNALLRQKKYDQAVQALHQAVNKGNLGLQGNGWYNLGNALYENGKYKEAADAYIQTLKINPADREAKQNLELALKKLQQQKSQSSGGGGQNDQQQKDQKSPQQDQSAGNKPNKQDEKQQNPPQGQDQKNQEQPANPQATQANGREGGLNKERALQILDALQNQELADQRKMLERQARRKAIGKDW
jgi:Ca-activated chloride channel homolog